MRTVSTAVSAAALMALAACVSDAPPENPQLVVNQRVTIMKSFVGALTLSGNFVQGKGTAAVAQTKVAAALAGVDKLEELFPRGTALGDRGVATSRALSTIFSNRSDFDAKRETLGAALGTLDVALVKKSKPGADRALADVKSACNACHTRYRAPED
jgi:cytochrome c556